MRCEDVPNHPHFRPLASVDGIAVDLRYAGPHNFAGRDLYGGLDCAWLHRRAADALERSVSWLREHAPGHRLLILDALRPHRVQVALWERLAGTGLQAYLADPARGSIHSYGMAVDATLVDAHGRELDMGSAFDELSERSHPRLEAAHLASGVLSPRHVEHRQRLRAAMAAGGFAGIEMEWWHYDLLDRALVRRTFERVE